MHRSIQMPLSSLILGIALGIAVLAIAALIGMLLNANRERGGTSANPDSGSLTSPSPRTPASLDAGSGAPDPGSTPTPPASSPSSTSLPSPSNTPAPLPTATPAASPVPTPTPARQVLVVGDPECAPVLTTYNLLAGEAAILSSTAAKRGLIDAGAVRLYPRPPSGADCPTQCDVDWIQSVVDFYEFLLAYNEKAILPPSNYCP